MLGDSYQDAFPVVALLRSKTWRNQSDSQTKLAFVFGNARVAPMKPLTIPKLELQAAFWQLAYGKNYPSLSRVLMRANSTTVLRWLNSIQKQPVFVANQVADI